MGAGESISGKDVATKGAWVALDAFAVGCGPRLALFEEWECERAGEADLKGPPSPGADRDRILGHVDTGIPCRHQSGGSSTPLRFVQ